MLQYHEGELKYMLAKRFAEQGRPRTNVMPGNKHGRNDKVVLITFFFFLIKMLVRIGIPHIGSTAGFIEGSRTLIDTRVFTCPKSVLSGPPQEHLHHIGHDWMIGNPGWGPKNNAVRLPAS